MNENTEPLTRLEAEEWWDRVPGARRFMKMLGREAEKNAALAVDIDESELEGFLTIFTDEFEAIDGLQREAIE